MKKVKLIIGLILAGFVALLIMQNKEYFFSKVGFRLDFYFRKYQIPEVHNVILFLAVFLVGLFIAYTFSLLSQYKSKKTLKNLNMTLKSQMEVISDLKSEIAVKDAQLKELSGLSQAFQKSAESVAQADSTRNDAGPAEVDAAKEVDATKEEENKIS